MHELPAIVKRCRRRLYALRLVLEAAVALVAAGISSGRIDIIKGDAQRSIGDVAFGPGPPALVGPLVVAVNRASVWVTRGDACLPRALALRGLLDRRGTDSELKLGTRQAPSGRYEAHAWLEYRGTVLIGQLPDLETFIPLEKPSASHST